MNKFNTVRFDLVSTVLNTLKTKYLGNDDIKVDIIDDGILLHGLYNTVGIYYDCIEQFTIWYLPNLDYGYKSYVELKYTDGIYSVPDDFPYKEILDFLVQK